MKEITLRYEVRPDGVFKKANNSVAYYKIEGEELSNFVDAARKYLYLIKTELYHA